MPADALAKIKTIIDEEIEKLKSTAPEAREVQRALNGIGQAVAQSFAASGARGVLVVDRDATAGEATAALAIAQFVDLGAERARLTKELGVLDADIDRAARKLGNPDFIARAKEEAVEETREKLAEAQGAKAKLEAALDRLSALS